MTDIYATGGMKTAMTANLGNMFSNQMMGAFNNNAEYDVKGQALGSLLHKDRSDCSGASQAELEEGVAAGIEKGSLQQHFDV